MLVKSSSGRIGALLFLLLSSVGMSRAQSSSFIYQGRLTDGGTGANGVYDLQFGLWDSVSTGTQIGSTITINTVTVSGGSFSVSLDFGAGSFNGANRFLEISSRPSGSGSFTLLSPRQQVTATPYAIRSLSASSADSVTVTGVPAGNGNYIQNRTSQQANTNFNITGNGTVGGTLAGNVVAATAHFNIGADPVLSATPDGVFVGMQSGQNNTGINNAFLGSSAGNANTSGSQNSFFGTNAGFVNSVGKDNTLIGFFAGGGSNSTGDNNTMIGANTGAVPGTSDSTLVGENARALSVSSLTNATAIGTNAIVTRSNSLILGSTSNTNIVGESFPDTNVGIGTTAPSKRLEVGSATIGDGINIFGTGPAFFLSDGGKNEKGALGFAGQAGLYSIDAAAGDMVLRSLSGRLILQHGSGIL